MIADIVTNGTIAKTLTLRQMPKNSLDFYYSAYIINKFNQIGEVMPTKTKKTVKVVKKTDYALIVTEVRVLLVKLKKSKKMLAIADVVLNGQLKLTGLRVFDGVNGLFVCYPIDPKPTKDGCYHSIYYPITKELREEIENVILKKYEEIINS